MSYYFNWTFYICLAIAFMLTSCYTSSINSPNGEPDSQKIVPSVPTETFGSVANRQNKRYLDIDSMQDVNRKLAEQGLNVRLAFAETVTKPAGQQIVNGQTIFANDRHKRLDAQWVPGDERRNANGNKLTYLVDQTRLAANGGTGHEIDGEPAIDASFDTWNSVKKNTKLEIVKVSDPGKEPSAFFGGDPFQADISEIGFMPGYLLDIVGSGASEYVLGVTFTAVFVDEAGNPTDIDNDGHTDIAFKEVWYNDDFQWTNQANGINTDIETVALHENGHALGLGHYGKIFDTNGNGKLHVTPRAVMNAIVLGTQRELLGTDKASYNSVYGNWPK